MDISTFKDSIRQSVTVKFVVVGLLTLILLIPAAMIKSLILEREQTRNEVIQEISSKWGNRQTLTGPILTVPYKVYYKKNDGEIHYNVHYAHFLPEKLDINGTLDPEIRYRSIYKVILYKSKVAFSGTFSRPNFDNWKIDNKHILWDEAFISMGIPDMRGIKEAIRINFNGKEHEVNPGTPSKDIIKSGISSLIDLSNDTNSEDYSFNFQIDINGSESIDFIPVGKTTNVSVNSEWITPSFNGAFLPDKRTIDKNGFIAKWTILHLNRNFPQQWIDNEYSVANWSFGVSLLFSVDQYQKSHRSAKYAIMFIALTFLTFFFSEVLNKKRVHPIQYLLIGFALCIFYTLLISLSEHIGFSFSYLIGSIAIITMITAYSASVLKDKKLTVLVCLILIALYIFLFTILQLEAYSLLMGSIGLFIVMSVIMYLSRNVDWYRPINKGND